MKILITLITTSLCFITTQVLYAQMPANWNVTPSNFNNSMVITAVLNMQSVQSLNPQDAVVAFINGEVRGVAFPTTYIKSSNIYLASLIVYSNDTNGLITFKLFNSASNKVSDAVITPINFEADSRLGSFEVPFVIKDNNIPSELTLSDTTINEKLPEQTLIGNFRVVDLDVADTHVFSLTDNKDFYDNAFFELKNNSLYSKVIFIYDDKSSYTIEVQAEDPKKGKIVKTFIIDIKKDDIGDVFEFNNLITHNEDGYNDVLKINYINFYKDYHLFVYNKQGQLVFSSSNYNNDWNGGENPDGVYYLYFSGKNQQGKEFIYKEALRIINN